MLRLCVGSKPCRMQERFSTSCCDTSVQLMGASLAGVASPAEWVSEGRWGALLTQASADSFSHTLKGARQNEQLKAAVLSDDCLPSRCFRGRFPWRRELGFFFCLAVWNGEEKSTHRDGKQTLKALPRIGHTSSRSGRRSVCTGACVQARASLRA